jgi:hypothetical protein
MEFNHFDLLREWIDSSCWLPGNFCGSDGPKHIAGPARDTTQKLLPSRPRTEKSMTLTIGGDGVVPVSVISRLRTSRQGRFAKQIYRPTIVHAKTQGLGGRLNLRMMASAEVKARVGPTDLVPPPPPGAKRFASVSFAKASGL